MILLDEKAHSDKDNEPVYKHLEDIFGQLNDHPIKKMMLNSERTKRRHERDVVYTPESRARMKHRLKELDEIIDVVKKNVNATKFHDIAASLQDPKKIYEVITEITWLHKWLSRKMSTEIEPLGKNGGGPDAKLTINGRDIFCEITAKNISNIESKRYDIEEKICHNIPQMPIAYRVDITTCREISDNEVEPITLHIKNKIIENYGETHFRSEFDNETILVYADNHANDVQVHRIPSGEELEQRTFDIRKDPIYTTINTKMNQLNKAGNGVKVLILDYSRVVEPLYLASRLKAILGKLEFVDKMIMGFNSLEFKDLSAIIAVYQADNELHDSVCFINKQAEYPIIHNEIKKIAGLI